MACFFEDESIDCDIPIIFVVVGLCRIKNVTVDCSLALRVPTSE